MDFEATHLNYRVSEFALAWRGVYDEVILGYDEVNRLSGLDRALLAPAWWARLLWGLVPDYDEPELGWTVRKLLTARRSWTRPRTPADGAAHSPVAPSSCSLMRSACPACRAVSSTMCTTTQRTSVVPCA